MTVSILSGGGRAGGGGLTPSSLSARPYHHGKCAQQAVKWKSLMAPLSVRVEPSLSPLCPIHWNIESHKI